ncbi:MAG: polymer-forming cytoskeletal protein [Candidatus Hydrogenedentota bacterium]
MRKSLVRACLLAVIMLPAADAFAPYWISTWIGIQAPGLDPMVVDGDKGDWLAGIPDIANTAALISDGTDTEWVWRDKIGDVRSDFDTAESSRNWDIKQIRIKADATNLYFLVEVDEMSAGYQNAFQFNVAIDTEFSANVNGGTAGFNWFGDDAGTTMGSPLQKSEINLAMDNDVTCKMWMFYDQSYGQPWKQLTWASGNKVWIDDSDNLMEACVKWSELGFASVPARLRLTMGVARKPWDNSDPNNIDKTTDLTGSDMLDVVSFGASSATDEWQDDLNDAVVTAYVDLAFDATGKPTSTLIPSAPVNLKAYDEQFGAWCTSGETVYTNNPLIAWDAVSPGVDLGESVIGYYVQICTSATVGGTGFFYSDSRQQNRNPTGGGPDNRVVFTNTSANDYRSQPWWGSSDSLSGVPNADTSYAQKRIFHFGQTYYIRVWARTRRGILGNPSSTFVLPIDYPVWHDPYVFIWDSGTMRGNRDPMKDADVNFMVGVYDTAPGDPGDQYYTNASTNQRSSNEILNIILHIRKKNSADDWTTNVGKVILGNEWKGSTGDIAWYTPSVPHNTYLTPDPTNVETFTVWRTGGSVDFNKNWWDGVDENNFVNLGNNGGGNTFKLQANVGDVIEYFFEINNPNEAPGGFYSMSEAPRRFLHAYDTYGITGHQMGTYANAKGKPFRFVVQRRDLPAIWHNPLSNEVPLDSGYMMRNPAWPDTSPQDVRMHVGGVGWGGWNFQMVWRNVDAGGAWNTDNFFFNGLPISVQTDTPRKLYYYRHNFSYTGGQIEYYFKLNDNSAYIFANGVTDNQNDVYDNSIGNETRAAVPFRFPYSNRVRVVSTASVGKDSHTIVAVLHLRSPQLDAIDENAIGVSEILNMSTCSGAVTGNIFSNAFPSVHYARSDTHGIADPRKIRGKSYQAILSGSISDVLATVVTGLQKAFFGPIFPNDYVVTDSTRWNTGSDAYENVPILTYDEVFKDAIEKTEPPGTTFNDAKPIIGVTLVRGDAIVSSLSAVTKGALICTGTITIPASAVINATRLDLFSLGGQLNIHGRLEIETGILFSNDAITLDSTAVVKLKNLGSVVSQSLTLDSGSQLQVKHLPDVAFLESKESVLSRATRWVISTLRETR